ncbi:MAG: hypothetical protein IKJ43_01600 [Bacilli bacterium]|nr:hypothetical protein [Bacilli bacterium]
MNKTELMDLINDLKINKNEFWILSSGALVIRGILEKANDLDIAVTENGLKELKENYNIKSIGNNKYIITDNIECVLETKKPWKIEKYENFYIQSIEGYYEFIKNSSREKDKQRIPLIEKYIKR